jgi:hypothetical protein
MSGKESKAKKENPADNQIPSLFLSCEYLPMSPLAQKTPIPVSPKNNVNMKERTELPPSECRR